MEEIFEYIFKKRDSISKLSLSRINFLLEYLGNPQDKLKFIHIAGTNGKGSITTTLSNILIEAGYKVGKYISPYVDNFSERIQINNTYISQQDIKNILQKLMPCIESMIDAPTPFEILAAIAFEYFYINKCEIVCLEVGLGGRFDATNCISTTLVSIISVIDYDHMDYLGNTIEEIAFEKCGIIKENKVVVSYPLQRENAYKMIRTMADIRKNKFITIDLNELKDIHKVCYNYEFTYKKNKYILGLNGKHQIYNALVVIETINSLNNFEFNIPYEIMYNAIKNTKFIGRLDKVNDNPTILLDGAHNPSGAKALKEFILDNNKDKKIILIIGMIEGKQHKEFFKELKGLASNIIITKIKDEIKKSADISMLYNIAKEYNESVQIELDHKCAYDKALKLANKDDIIIITGSLYLISEIYELLRNNK